MVKMINTDNQTNFSVFGDDGGADDGASDVMVVMMVKMINTTIIKLNISHGRVFGDDGCDDVIL